MSGKVGHRKHEAHNHGDSHGGGDHGGEEWLISYADLMTLLVGFFVILLSFANVDEEKLAEAAKSVTQEFGGTYESPYGELADRVKAALKKAGLGDQIIVKSNPNGVDISFLGTAFFTPGSADFKPEAQAIFDKLIESVRAEIQKFKITIEGHTDDVPLSSGGEFKNNFELSSIRACRVLDYFQKAGFDSKKMTAIGFGETQPVVPNRDSEGRAIPQNQSQNRRVIIKLTSDQKASL